MKGNELQIRLAANLKKFRKRRGLTQFALAEAANISEVTVHKIEACSQWPSESKLMELSSALGIDVAMLFLPVSQSFEVPQEIQDALKDSLRQKFSCLVNEILDELEK